MADVYDPSQAQAVSAPPPPGGGGFLSGLGDFLAGLGHAGLSGLEGLRHVIAQSGIPPLAEWARIPDIINLKMQLGEDKARLLHAYLASDPRYISAIMSGAGGGGGWHTGDFSIFPTAQAGPGANIPPAVQDLLLSQIAPNTPTFGAMTKYYSGAHVPGPIPQNVPVPTMYPDLARSWLTQTQAAAGGFPAFGYGGPFPQNWGPTGGYYDQQGHFHVNMGPQEPNVPPGPAAGGQEGGQAGARTITGQFDRNDPAFDQAAAKYNLPPGSAAILRGIAEQESTFWPNARGAAGERGMMQFTPGTAARYGLSNPDDPYASIDAAARAIRDNLAQTGGNVRQALSIYNSGTPNGAPGYANDVLAKASGYGYSGAPAVAKAPKKAPGVPAAAPGAGTPAATPGAGPGEAAAAPPGGGADAAAETLNQHLGISAPPSSAGGATGYPSAAFLPTGEVAGGAVGTALAGRPPAAPPPGPVARLIGPSEAAAAESPYAKAQQERGANIAVEGPIGGGAPASAPPAGPAPPPPKGPPEALIDIRDAIHNYPWLRTYLRNTYHMDPNAVPGATLLGDDTVVNAGLNRRDERQVNVARQKATLKAGATDISQARTAETTLQQAKHFFEESVGKDPKTGRDLTGLDASVAAGGIEALSPGIAEDVRAGGPLMAPFAAAIHMFSPSGSLGRVALLQNGALGPEWLRAATNLASGKQLAISYAKSLGASGRINQRELDILMNVAIPSPYSNYDVNVQKWRLMKQTLQDIIRNVPAAQLHNDIVAGGIAIDPKSTQAVLSAPESDYPGTQPEIRVVPR